MRGDFSAFGFRSLRLGVSIATLTSGLAWAGLAQAQTTPLPAVQADTVSGQSLDPEASDVPAEEADIVVTGTLLRGVAPTGTNVVSVTRDDVLVSGAASSNDLLASIPQVGNFGTVPVGSASFAIPVVRPNIRNLGSSGGVTTLVLVNGHRMVGAGVLQTTFDPSAIPPDIIERVEVVPDGGSAIYGSDAIGGVINFITRKRFNGVGASARYSFGDDYQGVDGNLTGRARLGQRVAVRVLCLCLARQYPRHRPRLCHRRQPGEGRHRFPHHHLRAGHHHRRGRELRLAWSVAQARATSATATTMPISTRASGGIRSMPA